MTKIFGYLKMLIGLWALRKDAFELWKKVVALNEMAQHHPETSIDFKESVKTLLKEAPTLVTQDGKVITFGGISGKGIDK